LQLDVQALSGSYNGALAGGTITGQWKQPGAVLPLTLRPYQKPLLAKADIDILMGDWIGPLKVPGGSLTFVTRFKLSDQGELQGTLTVPEQNTLEFPLTDIQFASGHLAFTVPMIHGDYAGTYANGAIAGAWHQPGSALSTAGMPVTFKKGAYTAVAHGLKLSIPAFVALSGPWRGTLQVTSAQGQSVSVPLVLSFHTNEQAEMIATVDSPSQHAMGVPVTEASLTGNKLVVKLASLNAEYTGDLNGKTVVGQWRQGAVNAPLTFTRE
jgi:hypothetical protein